MDSGRFKHIYSPFPVSVKPVLYILLLIIFTTPFTLPAQEPVTKSRKPSEQSDSLDYVKRREQINRADEFYDNLQSRADTSWFLKHIHPLLFRKSPSPVNDSLTGIAAPNPFMAYKGKVIRSVSILRLDAFGTSVYDPLQQPATRMQRALNKIHFNTRESVVKKYLLIRKGDVLDPVTLADNERAVRDASIFEDARFTVSSVSESDSIDLVLIVKDIFPIGFDLTVIDAERSRFKLFNRNLGGLGYQAEQSFHFNLMDRPAVQISRGAGKFRNIGGSFTDAGLFWSGLNGNEGAGIQISRPFFSPEIRLGGGLILHRQYLPLIPESDESGRPLQTETDIWGGYSTIINRIHAPASDRVQALVTARYLQYNLQNKPVMTDSLQRLYPAFKRWISEIGLIRSGFYLNNMIYGFGHTEDIPTGYHAGLLFGYETTGTTSGVYAGLRFSSGVRINGSGYLFAHTSAGTFVDKQVMYNSATELALHYISGIKKSGSYRLRHFASLNLKNGFNRTDSYGISLADGNSNTYSDYTIRGDHRFTARIETVVFTPYYLLGFRFAFFGFAETGMVTSILRNIMSERYYPALGIGIRVRNENLAFSTFQVSLAWHPAHLPGNDVWIFGIGHPDQAGFSRFGITAPDIVEFH